MLYSFRIKIVALRLRTASTLPHLTLRCTLDNRTLAEKQVQMQDGLLVENTTISFHLDAASLALAKPAIIHFREKEITSVEIGTSQISMRDFESVKMRKFAITSRDAKEEAYMQAFLLMLQSREQTSTPAVSLPTVRSGHFSNFSKVLIAQSKVHIDMENSSCASCIQPESPRSLIISSPTLQKIQSQEMETQTYNIESLLTLNSILEQANSALEKQKERLQMRLKKLEATIQSQQTRRHIDHQYKLRIEQMHDEIERMREDLRQAEVRLKGAEMKIEQQSMEIDTYQQEISKKGTIIDELKQKNLHYEQQISMLQEKQCLSVKELNTDEMMLELTKYSQTAKRYKNNASKETSGLGPMKMSSFTQNRSSVKDFLKISQRSQSRRHQSRNNLGKNCPSVQQTLDSMTESKVFS